MAAGRKPVVQQAGDRDAAPVAEHWQGGRRGLRQAAAEAARGAPQTPRRWLAQARQAGSRATLRPQELFRGHALLSFLAPCPPPPQRALAHL